MVRHMSQKKKWRKIPDSDYIPLDSDEEELRYDMNLNVLNTNQDSTSGQVPHLRQRSHSDSSLNQRRGPQVRQRSHSADPSTGYGMNQRYQFRPSHSDSHLNRRRDPEQRQRSRSMGSTPLEGQSDRLDNEIKYSQNLKRIYGLLMDRDSEVDQQMIDKMRSELSKEKKKRPIDLMKRSVDRSRSERRMRREDKQRFDAQMNVRTEPAFPQTDGHRPVYNDFEDLQSEMDRRAIDRIRDLPTPRPGVFGSGVDYSSSIRDRQMDPLAQRSNTLLEAQDRRHAASQVDSARGLRYSIDRNARIERRNRRAGLQTTTDFTDKRQDLEAIPEATPAQEKWWDYDFDELD